MSEDELHYKLAEKENRKIGTKWLHIEAPSLIICMHGALSLSVLLRTVTVRQTLHFEGKRSVSVCARIPEDPGNSPFANAAPVLVRH